MKRLCNSPVSKWIWRVNSVLVFNSNSSVSKSWSALACWKAAWRFWPIITNVDRKIASSETTRVNVGQGFFSNTNIQTANNTAWIQTKFIDPANAVIRSARRS